MAPINKQDLPIFSKWMDFLEWFFPLVDRFPQKARFSFATRLQNLSLDFVEDLVDARYRKEARPILISASLRLEKLRIVLRLAWQQKYLSHKSFEQAQRNIDETGRMLGGWIRSLGAQV
jgi:hypothetical protein